MNSSCMNMAFHQDYMFWSLQSQRNFRKLSLKLQGIDLISIYVLMYKTIGHLHFNVTVASLHGKDLEQQASLIAPASFLEPIA